MAKRFLEKRLRSKRIHKGVVNFNVDSVRLPNGKSATREYVDHPGAVAVVPFVDKETVVMVRQYRYPVGKTTYEIPAGKFDRKESAVKCLRRELREETGYTAGVVRRLVTFWPAPAFSNEALHIYMAERLKPGKMSPDEDEFIEAVTVPFRQALEWVFTGAIKDAKTIIGLLACSHLRSGGKGNKRRKRH